MKKVLFVCVHNAGRSQMAEAFFNRLAKGKTSAVSAGTVPATQIIPTVIEAMGEVGIDISGQRPKALTPEMIEDVDRVITMGCSVEKVCPASFVPTEDWELEDPEGKPIEKVRQVRDEIRNRVEKLIKELQDGESFIQL
ncbi:MAG: arsenate reductase [Chloroflexi bacterium RBG_13_54_9]|nr:MAG: arsenate reductase [Chloroflexi bacterium RBG_13_54_9]